MPSFGYTSSGGGVGSSDALVYATLAGTYWHTRFYPYVNDSGSPVLVDTATLHNVIGGIGVAAEVLVYDSIQTFTGLPERLIGQSAALSGLAAGTNTFTFATPFIVDAGTRVWVAVITNGAGLTAGATERTLSETVAWGIEKENWGWTAPNPFPGTSGWARTNIAIPVDLSGAVATLPSTDLREALTVNEPVTEGPVAVSEALAVNEPLTEGNPDVRDALTVNEPLGEGDPYVRVPLLVLETLIDIPEAPPMVTAVFPALLGLSWSVIKTPNFNTQVRRSTSALKISNSLTPDPIWNFELSFEFLEDDDGQPNVALGTTDLKYLLGFFLAARGKDGLWLFRDPTDYAVNGGVIGTGDAVTTEFRLARNEGGLFLEPIGQLSQAVKASFLPAAVNPSTDTITVTAHGLSNNDGPFFVASTGAEPGGLTALTPYWIVNATTNTFQLAAVKTGAAVDITSAGTGLLTLTDGLAIYLSGPEAATVPGSGPYTVTVSRTPVGIVNSVTLDSSGAALAFTAGAPAAGQYAVNTATGVFTFNAAQAGAAIHIDYLTLDSPAAYAFSGQNLVTFGAAPPAGLAILADFKFYFVCNFLEDKADFENFAESLWSLSKLTFESNITG